MTPATTPRRPTSTGPTGTGPTSTGPTSTGPTARTRPVPVGLRAQFRETLRERVLETASAAATEQGWGQVRMADLARRAGVSRSAIHREFGDKEAVAHALVAHESDRVIAEVGQALIDAPDWRAGIAAALRTTMAARENHPLIHAVLTGEHDDVTLLPQLTTGSTAIIARARVMLSTWLRGHHPRLPRPMLDDAADVLVRAALSHLTAPEADRELAVARLQRLAVRLMVAQRV
ncbi:TetR/AcrR family transcriptional regulator [Actinomycetospora termitidis]|uniref:TetR family transcriptional regulator n=1 Tax=Actinomycetospora termitidis TaxID=3053470 RepID=A0ABT7MG13_9PSEU|nr:TetR family transcriptional regulator [Actinomycetospora sp. Odt1-22]MDL5159609.1 TetR family transcriptional regulator [Actinomycetospora sp. Odt1-22]